MNKYYANVLATEPVSGDMGAWVKPVYIASEVEAEVLRLNARIAELEKPIDCILHCPCCGAKHVDAPTPPAWTNPPHRSHLCHACGKIWRPSDRATNGVAFIKTKGTADTIDMRDATASEKHAFYTGDAHDIQ